MADERAVRIEVSNDELATIRDAMRGLNRMVAALERGEAAKFVLTKGGRMRAVLIPVESYLPMPGRSGEGQ